MPASSSGGRHELGQNFLTHRPTIRRIAALVSETTGPILEIGAGDGALTRVIATLGRPFTAVDIDEHRVRRLRRALPGVRVEHADALRYPIAAPVVVGNIPFHLTTPILRRLLAESRWRHAIVLTQWEVARKRAGVGGHTLMTAQSAPWFEFRLHDRVPSWAFAPRPSVDGGLLTIERRGSPLLPEHDRRAYEAWVRAVFTGAGGTMTGILRRTTSLEAGAVRRAMARAGVAAHALPRDLTAPQWAALWRELHP
jgi:23S rRNA (adenine-N6)-dimethyltransferase